MEPKLVKLIIATSRFSSYISYISEALISFLKSLFEYDTVYLGILDGDRALFQCKKQIALMTSSGRGEPYAFVAPSGLIQPCLFLTISSCTFFFLPHHSCSSHWVPLEASSSETNLTVYSLDSRHSMCYYISCWGSQELWCLNNWFT